MKRQIELIRTVIAVMLAAVALALVVFTLATAAPPIDQPVLPTLTAPAPNTTPGATANPYPPPYPGPPTPNPYPAPPGYPAFLPVQVDVESYP